MVKIFDLQREYEGLKDELAGAFKRVCKSGEFILGKEVSAFEEAFARYTGVHFAAGLGSGTDALRIGGLALGLKAGDKVVTTPNTYIATVMALSVHGITPVFCDIDPEDMTMDPGSLEEALKANPGVKVCIPVHLYGHTCRMEEIMDVCGRFGVSILEDACQAHGALYKGRKVGTFGAAAAFSFYPTKNLGAYGDAGGLVTADRHVYDEICRLRNYGQTGKHVHTVEGFNSRLDELQAAILSVKLRVLDAANESRRHLADIYRMDLEDDAFVALPVEQPGRTYIIFTSCAAASGTRFRSISGRRGVGSLVHCPRPSISRKRTSRLGYQKGAFPQSEKAADEILTLPLYPTLKEDEVVYVCSAIRAFYAR